MEIIFATFPVVNSVSTSQPSGPGLEVIFKYITDVFPLLVTFVRQAWDIAVVVSFPLALFFLIGVIYCTEQLKRIREKEFQLYDLKVEESYETVDKGDPNLARRWESVMRHIESSNQSDWKQAIIEADIILDELLTKMEYRGESVGEKLKRVEKSDFDSLDEAWEAHKMRNQIAHEGSDVSLSQYEAKRIINLYKKVFEEFYYI